MAAFKTVRYSKKINMDLLCYKQHSKTVCSFIYLFTFLHVSAVIFGHHQVETQVRDRKSMLWKRPSQAIRDVQQAWIAIHED